jgi:hypothetical protein
VWRVLDSEDWWAPDDARPGQQPVSEEARAILRRIVESLAWRQLATINILGHG